MICKEQSARGAAAIPPRGEAHRQAPPLARVNQAQATVDALAAAAAKAVAAWDAGAVAQSVERIEASGLAPSRSLLLANLLRSHGFNELAARMLRLQTSGELPRIGHVLTSAVNQLSAGYASDAALRAARAAYAQGLRSAVELARREPREVLAAHFPDSLTAMPFYLAYQGLRDRDLQALYGEAVTRMVGAALPTLRLTPPPLTGRTKIVFATAFCHIHSVMKMCISWIEGIDKGRFETVFLHLGKVADAMTERVRRAVDHFEMGERTIEQWRETAARHRPHLVVYLEIGMDALTLALATQRLAPVQCVTWGHPQTSGLPAIDYFLSSDLMEPEGAEADYTETLVRLPNLSVNYAPLKTRQITLDRGRLGASADDTIYLCCQSLFKYLPSYDFIFPRIAVLAPRARFVFIARSGDPALFRFARRLAQAFADFSLNWRDHVVFCEPLPFDQFAGFLRMGDVFLDSIGWSGANTTLEAIDVGLPVVTLPTGLMRGRHSGAILTMMGMADAIAASVEDYVDKAAALARPDHRLTWAEEIRRRKGRLFGDETPIRALECFFEAALVKAYAALRAGAETRRGI